MSDPATTITNLLRMERAATLEEAALLVGSPRNYKLNDGRSDISNAAREKLGEEIRALAPLAPTLVVVEREVLERIASCIPEVLGGGKPRFSRSDLAALKEALK